MSEAMTSPPTLLGVGNTRKPQNFFSIFSKTGRGGVSSLANNNDNNNNNDDNEEEKVESFSSIEVGSTETLRIDELSHPLVIGQDAGAAGCNEAARIEKSDEDTAALIISSCINNINNNNNNNNSNEKIKQQACKRNLAITSPFTSPIRHPKRGAWDASKVGCGASGVDMAPNVYPVPGIVHFALDEEVADEKATMEGAHVGQSSGMDEEVDEYVLARRRMIAMRVLKGVPESVMVRREEYGAVAVCVPPQESDVAMWLMETSAIERLYNFLTPEAKQALEKDSVVPEMWGQKRVVMLGIRTSAAHSFPLVSLAGGMSSVSTDGNVGGYALQVCRCRPHNAVPSWIVGPPNSDAQSFATWVGIMVGAISSTGCDFVHTAEIRSLRFRGGESFPVQLMTVWTAAEDAVKIRSIGSGVGEIRDIGERKVVCLDKDPRCEDSRRVLTSHISPGCYVVVRLPEEHSIRTMVWLAKAAGSKLPRRIQEYWVQEGLLHVVYAGQTPPPVMSIGGQEWSAGSPNVVQGYALAAHDKSDRSRLSPLRGGGASYAAAARGGTSPPARAGAAGASSNIHGRHGGKVGPPEKAAAIDLAMHGGNTQKEQKVNTRDVPKGVHQGSGLEGDRGNRGNEKNRPLAPSGFKQVVASNNGLRTASRSQQSSRDNKTTGAHSLARQPGPRNQQSGAGPMEVVNAPNHRAGSGIEGAVTNNGTIPRAPATGVATRSECDDMSGNRDQGASRPPAKAPAKIVFLPSGRGNGGLWANNRGVALDVPQALKSSGASGIKEAAPERGIDVSNAPAAASVATVQPPQLKVASAMRPLWARLGYKDEEDLDQARFDGRCPEDADGVDDEEASNNESSGKEEEKYGSAHEVDITSVWGGSGLLGVGLSEAAVRWMDAEGLRVHEAPGEGSCMYWCVVIALDMPRTLASVQVLRNIAAIGMLSGRHDGASVISERLPVVHMLHEYAHREEVQVLADALSIEIGLRSIGGAIPPHADVRQDAIDECVPLPLDGVAVRARGRIELIHNSNHYNCAIREVAHSVLVEIGQEVLLRPDMTQDVERSLQGWRLRTNQPSLTMVLPPACPSQPSVMTANTPRSISATSVVNPVVTDPPSTSAWLSQGRKHKNRNFGGGEQAGSSLPSRRSPLAST